MRRTLQAIAAAIILVMLVVTTTATLDRGVLAAGAALWPDPWFRATLVDAYAGFLLFYLWVWYKEPSGGGRALWLILIMTFGNFATGGFLLRELSRLGPGEPLDRLLLRRAA